MTVYRDRGRRTFDYDFEFEGKRYRGNTKQTRRDDAELVENRLKLQLRQDAGGVGIVGVSDTPRFQEWVEIYADHVRRRGDRRPERTDDLIRVALRFLGARPSAGARVKNFPDEPYHDLHLGDFVRDPSWILRWEDWLAAPHVDGLGRSRLWQGQTKNQYRSLLNGLFKLAIRPEWRQKTKVLQNPLIGTHRDAQEGREVSLEREELLAVIGCASYHLRIAIAVAMLSPKLREGNILALRYDEHFSPDMRYITVQQHKTRHRTRRPLVVYVPDQLRAILMRARASSRRGFVVEYQGKPVHELRGAVRGAVDRARADHPHLVYGREHADGVTFHTLRHTAATMLVDLDVSPEQRQRALGHRRLETTMGYTHLRPRHDVDTQERLSAYLPIADLVLQPQRRAPKSSTGKTTGTAASG